MQVMARRWNHQPGVLTLPGSLPAGGADRGAAPPHPAPCQHQLTAWNPSTGVNALQQASSPGSNTSRASRPTAALVVRAEK